MKKVLLAAQISVSFKEALVNKFYELISIEMLHLENNWHEIEGIITSNKLNLNATFLQQFSQLKWVARLGSGMEIIDTNYCDKNGIHYFNSPQGIANSVAEHVMGMLLSLLHHIQTANNEVRNAAWKREPNRGIELENQIVGIIGFGHTGSALAKKLSVFTNTILAYDKYKTGFQHEGVKEVSLIELQQQADIISIHLPLNDETFHYYNEAFINEIKSPHILINSSRGAIVDSQSLLAGLNNKKIKGACLDVLEEEQNIENLLQQPQNMVQQLLQYNVIITPHIAGYSHNAIEKMSDELLQQLLPIL